MIATTLLLFVAAALLPVAIVIFTPFGCTADFARSPGRGSGSVVLHWLSPRLVRFTVDVGQGGGTLFILGWSRRIEGVREPEPSTAGAHPPAAAGRTAAPEKKASDKLDLSDGSDESDKSDPPASPSARVSRLHRWMFVFRKVKKILAILFDPRLSGRTIRWLRRDLNLLLHLVRIHHIRLTVTAGVGDPAETGMLYGWYIALRDVVLSRRPHITIRFDPYFGGTMLEAEGSIGVTCSIARLLLAGSVVLIGFPWLTFLSAWRRLGKVRREPMPTAGEAVT